MLAAHNTSVLVIETDDTLAHQLATDLQEAGYEAIIAADATSGWQHCRDRQPALVVVDRMLVGESGLSFCKNLRTLGTVIPILILMARDTIDDRVACLEAGADDYILKPYRSEDFLQMIRLYLKPDVDTTEQLRFGDLVLNLGNRRATHNARVIDLTMKEFELLRFLMEHPREVLTREQILENVWGYDFLGESNVIEVYIRYLRLKIDCSGCRLCTQRFLK
jgi:OmpR family response regulator NblR